MNNQKLIKSVNWILTDKCNSKCTHCDIWQIKPKEESNIDTFNNFLDSPIIQESYKKYKTKFDISIGGGEPFLREDFQEIVDLVENKFPNSLKTISTNGLSTEKIIKFLKNNQKYDFKLNISIDGLKKTHDKIRGFDGAFEKTIKTIFLIKKTFPKKQIDIKLALMPQNYNQLIKVYNLSKKLGCDFSFKPVESMNNYTNKKSVISNNFTEEQLITIRKDCFLLSDMMYKEGNYKKSKFYRDIPFYLEGKKKPKTCSVLKDHITLMPNGDIYSCILEDKLSKNYELTKDIFKHPSFNDCKSCMLMCGSYKDYTNDQYLTNVANFEITNNCNLNCHFCTQKELNNNITKNLSFEKFKDIILNNQKINHVSFVGGESFLNPEFLKMLTYLDTQALTYEITSNGTLIDDKILEILKKSTGLKNLNFSLDGLEETHDKIRGKGVFNKCLKSILLLNKYFNVSVSSVITESNIEELVELSKFLAEKNVKNHKLIYGMNLSREEKIESKKRIDYLTIQGPKLDNQITEDSLNILLTKIKEESSINIGIEPNMLGSHPKLFINKKLVTNNLVYCRQLDQYRFDNNGNRIICEFIRNNYSESLKEQISKKLLPICEGCCKLELRKIEK